MKNRDYWRRRFEILEASAVNKGQDYLLTLDREYKTAMRNVEAELSKWYQRFAGNNGITLAEAKQWLNKGQLAEFKWSVEEYIKYGQENALNQQWMKQLENASAKVHVSRLQALQIEMQQKIEALYGNQLDGIDALARKIYTDGYYHTAFEVQKGFNIGWDLTPLNQKQLDRVITKPWTLDKETFSDRIWKQKNALVGRVQTEMTQSLLRGDSPDKAIKAISKQFDVSRKQAGRLVMTESAYFASEAQKDCFKGLDVERFEIVATLDSHTSDLCQSLDGHIEEMKNYEAGVTAPPFHPWCRTTTVPYFEDNFGERAARGADGKTYYVPSDMKYKDWKQSFVQNGSKEGLNPIAESDIIKNPFSLPKIDGEHTVQTDLTNANPNYSKGGGYRMNCGNCTVAYELRRRGFDVEANPMNGMYVSEWRKIFDGFNPSQAITKRKAGLVDELSKAIAGWGEGARGTIFVKWDGRKVGHFFSAEVSGGKVMFIDPQNAKADVASYFDSVKPSSVIYGRLDDLNMTDAVVKAVKKKG